MYYQNKVVWITGASSGIGEALAYALNKKGARLILSARREQELERVKKNCSGNPEDILVLPLDLTESDLFSEKTAEAKTHFGGVDILINNGGISQRAYALEADMASIRHLMEINFFGAIALTKAVVPAMIERGHGHVVVISSVMGKFGTRYRSAYAASKHALHGWFDCLRQEVQKDGIDVSIVCPGYVKTNVTKNALKADGTKLNEMGDAHKKAMSPDEFAEKLLPKLSAGKQEIYIGGKEIAAVYLKRFFPKLLNKILMRSKVT
ncbi:SDR family oxidoreductase [Rhodohalobacter sp. SW132]|uniref:SDR family oxidoreductase n=1 Tax=Rhodohalobacter sp. SW132 TaxID=2293433 RepID=UPI000E25354A|nr:SDR family oxidoreductase [Rhodohalobacter sp. SW132]REL24123.1 SDR family oxidoreductase [Rhodohalobacter sp. SW132]